MLFFFLIFGSVCLFLGGIFFWFSAAAAQGMRP